MTRFSRYVGAQRAQRARHDAKCGGWWRGDSFQAHEERFNDVTSTRLSQPHARARVRTHAHSSGDDDDDDDCVIHGEWCAEVRFSARACAPGHASRSDGDSSDE